MFFGMAPFEFICISTWESLDNDVDEILLRALFVELELELIQTHTTQKPLLRIEVVAVRFPELEHVSFTLLRLLFHR